MFCRYLCEMLGVVLSVTFIMLVIYPYLLQWWWFPISVYELLSDNLCL